MLEFSNECEKEFNDYETLFLSLVKSTMKTLNKNQNYLISVNIINNGKMHELNRTYRNIDNTTDVLSFAFLDDQNEEINYMDELPCDLGEIFISSEKAREQAKEYNHSIKREMCFLFVHGLLHLLGYDHQDEKQEKEMFYLQDLILKKENIYD